MRGLRIRDDLSASELRSHARLEKDPRVARRMLAIANALDGMSRALSARLAGMDRQALRDWVIRYDEAGLEGLCDRWGDGLIEERTGVRYSVSGTHRLVRSLNLSWQKTRPRHPEADPAAQKAFKKSSAPG